jgi:pimeloyl-ACP methyl ester carboxylesterase
MARLTSFIGRLLRAAGVVAALAGVAAMTGTLMLGSIEDDQRQRYPAPGMLVDIGADQQVHLRVWGDRGGKADQPTIILDAAASLSSSSWANVAEELSRTHRVVAYDRPGIGWSTGSGPRDARSAAMALSATLELADIEPPYVLVGHSYGGFSARMFAHLRPADVTGLVLLDSTHEAGGGAEGFSMLYRWRAWQGRMGLFQLAGPGTAWSGLPAADAEAAQVVERWRSHLDATADELEAWPISAQQLGAAGHHAELPLLVVSAYGSAHHYELQRDLAQLSNRSTYVELPVGHISLLFDRAQVALVTAQIRGFLGDLRPDR